MLGYNTKPPFQFSDVDKKPGLIKSIVLIFGFLFFLKSLIIQIVKELVK